MWQEIKKLSLIQAKKITNFIWNKKVLFGVVEFATSFTPSWHPTQDKASERPVADIVRNSCQIKRLYKKSEAGQRWTWNISLLLLLPGRTATYLADMGVLSMDELLLALFLLLPFAIGVDAFRGDDDPKPTGVCLSEDSRPPPERMLEDLRERMAFLQYFGARNVMRSSEKRATV